MVIICIIYRGFHSYVNIALKNICHDVNKTGIHLNICIALTLQNGRPYF